MNKRAHFIVRGRVQGVCYRMCAQQEANRLGLKGWVRNLHDGTVEVLAEGEEGAIGKFYQWCRKGPSYGRVTDVIEDYSESLDEFDSFKIVY